MQISKLLKFCPKTLALLLGGISVAALPPYYILPVVFLCFGGCYCFSVLTRRPKPLLPSVTGLDSTFRHRLFLGGKCSAGRFANLWLAVPRLHFVRRRFFWPVYGSARPLNRLVPNAHIKTVRPRRPVDGKRMAAQLCPDRFSVESARLGAYFPPRIFPNRFDLGDLRPDACFAALEHGSGFIFLSRLKILPPGCRRPPDCSSGFCGRFRIRPY